MKRRSTLLVLALSLGCSAIGDPGGYPDAYPHGGTGVFRPLGAMEIGIADGRAIVTQRSAVDAMSVAEGHLFYVVAPLVEMPPEVPAEHPRNEVYWPAFRARSIYRAAPRDNPGFAAGSQVLAASASWEGAEVFDPWVVVDGATARLYYAAEGGIGLAEASGVDGAFQRVGDGPILDASHAVRGVPRRPSVVRGPDGAFFLYYDAGGAIGVARSEDGRSFTQLDGDPATPEIDPLVLDGEDIRTSPELAVAAPGAVAVDTIVGRRLVRLYFESHREDGTILAYVAGSADGVTFERYSVPVHAQTDVRFPAPVVLDQRVTLLYTNGPATSGGFQTRGIYASVSPASTTFGASDN